MQEHMQLVEAIAGRDVSRATQILAEHLRHFPILALA
jgi:DNA-binding GntR family transcriptional regulator